MTSVTRSAARIAVDLNPLLADGENGGAARAAFDLAVGLGRRGRHVLLLVCEANAHLVDHVVGGSVDRVVVRRDSITPRRSPTALRWPGPWSLVRALGADVLFCPFGDPFWSEDGVPTVCTINDLQHLDHPEFFGAAELAHRDDYLGRLTTLADRIVVPSEFSRRSVKAHLRPSATVEVVPYAGPSPTGQLRSGRGDYLLYPANAWPHKNHERLLRAMAIHRKRCEGADRAPTPLVLTGALFERAEALQRQVAELGLEELVTVRGFVPAEEFDALLGGALGLVFPSLYEGFGLPVLEAMAGGVPVACSDSGSLPEVAGDAAVRFDPRDPDAIADAIDLLSAGGEEVDRLVEKGFAQAARFDRESSIDALLAVLDDAVVTGDQPRPPTLRPSISVVMPSYEQARFIGRSLDSVLEQGDAVKEVIVCDGGSTDGTVDVLDRYGSAISYVSEPDGGQSAAVNKAIAKATGELIAWLNSDDLYYRGALDLVATVFGHHPGLRWAYFACNHIASDDALIEPYYNRPWDATAFGDLCFICQPGCFFRAGLVHEVGGLDESLRYCMDYELWFRMSELQAPVYIPVVVAGSRLHDDTKTIGQRPAVFAEVISMLKRRQGRVSHRWLVAQIGDSTRRAQEWDDHDPADVRRRHRFALSLAARTFARHGSLPDRPAREVLADWTRQALSEVALDRRPQVLTPPITARLGARLPAATRRVVSYPYHQATRWVRRRTVAELEPRLRAIELGLEGCRSAMAEVMSSPPRPALELERIALAHHQAEEALLDRFVSEIESLRAQLERLRSLIDKDDDG